MNGPIISPCICRQTVSFSSLLCGTLRALSFRSTASKSAFVNNNDNNHNNYYYNNINGVYKFSVSFTFVFFPVYVVRCYRVFAFGLLHFTARFSPDFKKAHCSHCDIVCPETLRRETTSTATSIDGRLLDEEISNFMFYFSKKPNKNLSIYYTPT